MMAKRLPYLFVGWLWYAIIIAPVIGIIQIGNQVMADRYTYLPLIGIGIGMAWGIPALLKSESICKKFYSRQESVSYYFVIFLLETMRLLEKQH